MFAQIQPSAYNHIPEREFTLKLKGVNSNHARTAQCGSDTVYYAYGKAKGVRALNINNSNSADKICQWFDAPQQMTLHGFTFFAWQSSGTADTVALTCSAILAGNDSLPTGPIAATTTVRVDTVFGNGTLVLLEKTAMFSSPVSINFPYLLVIETYSPTAVSVVSSDWDSLDGGMEWLASANIPGTGWRHGYELSVGGPVFNADFLFQPIVTYEIETSFVTDTNCIHNGGAVRFDNTSYNPVLHSKFYNQHIFDSADSLIYSWKFGDGTPFRFVEDVLHTFVPGSNYEVVLSVNIEGWTAVCTESHTTTINPLTKSDFTYVVNGLDVFFSNSADHADTYYWVFGDGSTGTAANPLHTFPSKTDYNVSLVCVGPCNNDTINKIITLCDSVSSEFSYSISGSTVNFSVATLTGSASFLWIFDDASNGSGISLTHTYGSEGTYNVCLIATNDCISDTTCKTIQIAPTGIGDSGMLDALSIYPNPVTDKVTIRIPSFASGIPVQISLFNHVGRALRTINVVKEDTEINLNELSEGIYLMNVEMGRSNILRKIVITR